MSDTKHTPKPWLFDQHGNIRSKAETIGKIRFLNRKEPFVTISGVACPDEEIRAEAYANGEIIVKAVNNFEPLMEALRAISDALVAYDKASTQKFGGLILHKGRLGDEMMALIRAVEVARPAIAKAEGSKP